MIQRHLIATVLLTLISRANAFSYKDAKNWGKKYPQCNGKHQSPIILVPVGSVPSIDKKLKLTNLNELPRKMTIENTGHTVEVKADWGGQPPKISGGPLHGNYVFEKATFHWDEKPYIDGPVNNDPKLGPSQPYTLDMEVHMFFYRTDLKSFEKAQSQKRGLVAMRCLIKSGLDGMEYLFDNLENNLHKVRSPNSTVEIPPIRIASLPGDKGHILDFYEGSLDYPPCSESVTWIHDDGVISVPVSLVNEFRKIKLAEGDVSNLRPVQPLNKREPGTVFSITRETWKSE